MEVLQQQEVSLSLEDCLKLLKGERDEQRLAGLFLVTKICKGEDIASLTRIYDAVGVTFLNRLLKTGMGKGTVGVPGNENRDAYLQLSVRVLAVFCRVHEIASSKDMVLKIPLILESLSNQSCSAVLEDCFEFLYLVSTSSEDDAVMTLYHSGGLKVLASQMSMMTDGSHPAKLAIQLVQIIIRKLSFDVVISDFLSELSLIVSITARQFAILHDSTKFEALHLLSMLFSSNSTRLYDALRTMPSKNWSKHMHDGIMAILHNRVAPADKFHALILAESMMSMLGESWLIGDEHSLEIPDPPADRCLLLVLEQSRVEVAVLLNELAYMKYEASKNSSSRETIHLKQQNVAVAFSLLEKLIKLISNADENLGRLIDENTCIKVIMGLNETIGVVLEYLQDAKEHGERKGDDLLASVRVIGSYLAETPLACEEKVRELLEYMLSIEGEDEKSPFYSVCFLLPMLCQITMNVEGCKALATTGGYKAVIDCLVKLVEPNDGGTEDNGCIFLACDTILNFLLKKKQVQLPYDKSAFLRLLKALAVWTENSDDPSVITMAASLCSLICDYTSEDALLRDPDFGRRNLDKLSRLFSRSLSLVWQGMAENKSDNTDLIEIITTGYFGWGPKFPCIRDAVQTSSGKFHAFN